MQNKFLRLHALLHPWHHLSTEILLALFLILFIFIVPSTEALRFQERSLYILNNEPNEKTSYTVSFRYMSPVEVGSVEFLFCTDPIPHHDCVTPPGLDVSRAILASQTGETNFSLQSKSTNRLVLSRLPTNITSNKSSYVFDNIVNPTASTDSFSIRLKSHGSTDATGAQIDFGSVKGQVNNGIVIATQVPPMLIFCVAEEVADNCTKTNENNYTDMGKLSPQSTLLAQSQMAVGTNASGGFAITANGSPMSAGMNTIDSPKIPTQSMPGSNQFGLNLVANNAPIVGSNPEGEWANAITSPDYGIPNRYKYVSGDVIAYSPNVSLMKKFTVSYIVNSSESLRAGVYTTTITYIASGRF